MKSLIKIQLVVIVLLVILTGFTYEKGGKYFEISKNLEIFTNIYKTINTTYVDDLEPGPLMEKGIDAMLKSLDPYTVYYSESEIEAYRFKSQGNFSGIGAVFVAQEGLPVVKEIVEKGPSDNAGIRPGDVINEIDGRSAKDRSMAEVNNILQGFAGTDVSLSIKRFSDNLDTIIQVTRGETSANNVPHFELISDDIAYANLSTFTRDAANNVLKAYNSIKLENSNIKGYILDLRGNGGGLLSEAVNLCNIFLPKNVLVVTTKSKVVDWDQSYSTTALPMDNKTPLVVLVDDSSASASEIVSGTIQDYDRGVVIGQRTYGKGLVQRTEDIGYNSKMKLTISEYYIPSGRCIQAVQYNDKGEPVPIPKEERSNFKTKNGRTVQDGGGVLPDIVLNQSEAEDLIDQLEADLHIFNYVNDYIRSNKLNLATADYSYTDINGFFTFIEKDGFSLDSKMRKQLNKSLKMASEEDNAQLITELKSMISSYDQRDLIALKASSEEITSRIEREIISRFHYLKGKVIHQLKNDVEVQKAIEILNDRSLYNKTLNL